MSEFLIRTEELSDDLIKEWYVETEDNCKIINALKARSPVLLVGSRGMGKTYLFKIAQMQLLSDFPKDRVFPIFLTFRGAPLVQTGNKGQFEVWMMNRICTTLIRELKKAGLIVGKYWTFGNITDGGKNDINSIENLMEITEKFEKSWKTPGMVFDTSMVPNIDEFMEIVEDVCNELNIKRIIVFLDEAAHVFMPEQQRQFFGLFREIRSAYIKCNAAVYPGVTFYGDTFEPVHDALTINLTRDIREENYVESMKKMVIKQIQDSELLKSVLQYGENLKVLIYAAGGNPRLLFRSIAKVGNLNKASMGIIFREFYREEIWSEQSGLADKYPSYSAFVDWGRYFIEDILIPEIKNKNDKFIMEKNISSIYFWIHRNSPQVVKEAMRILEYTGIIKLNATGIKATDAEIGSRYEINLGCLLAYENNPINKAFDIVHNLSLGKMTEYGANSKVYQKLLKKVPDFMEPDISECLKIQLDKDIECLELTSWQKSKLYSLKIFTIGDLLRSKENDLMKAYYVGEKKARDMKNAAMAAVFEYLVG